jgi:hypothetical protein
LFRTLNSSRPYLIAPHLRKTPLFFEFPLCLSRACLGKMIVFIHKWRKKWRFSHHNCIYATTLCASTTQKRKKAHTTQQQTGFSVSAVGRPGFSRIWGGGRLLVGGGGGRGGAGGGGGGGGGAGAGGGGGGGPLLEERACSSVSRSLIRYAYQRGQAGRQDGSASRSGPCQPQSIQSVEMRICHTYTSHVVSARTLPCSSVAAAFGGVAS